MKPWRPKDWENKFQIDCGYHCATIMCGQPCKNAPEYRIYEAGADAMLQVLLRLTEAEFITLKKDIQVAKLFEELGIEVQNA